MSSDTAKEKSAFDQIKVIFLALPVIVLLILSAILMGNQTTIIILRWYLMLILFGMVSFPFACHIFKWHGTGGFFLAKIMTLVGTSLLVWTLTYIRIFKFTSVFVVAALVIIAAACYDKLPQEFRDIFDRWTATVSDSSTT